MSSEAPEKKPKARVREPRTAAARVHRVTYVVGRRPLKLGDRVLQIGEEVPGAEEWPRVESWVRAGRLVQQ